MNSSANIGVFRGRKLKRTIGTDVPPHMPSQHLLQNIAPELEWVDVEHSAIGEQYGVRREWCSPELGDGNVITLCDLAWVKIGQILSDAHRFAGWHSVPPVEHGHKVEDCATLLETDLDPDLFQKWGW